MYSTCLFCHAKLGSNELVEDCPVGRRVAFDADKGRLWVVCRRCERWNLTPIEERWEAIEAAERLYRSTRTRVATDQVGLARLRDGEGAFELVRIGRPLRPEFAAWRYGDQFGRRRRRHLLLTGGAAAVGGAMIVAGPLMGLFGFSVISPVLNLFNVVNAARQSRKVVQIPMPGREALSLKRQHIGRARLVGERGEWYLSLVVLASPGAPTPSGRAGRRETTVRLTGADAVRAAGALLPAYNAAGAGERRVQEAVRLLEEQPDPEALLAAAARENMRRWADSWQLDDAGGLRGIPIAQRLALEMASHEETERRALEGELALLEESWRAAEEIAAIADDLTLPESVVERLGRLKGR